MGWAITTGYDVSSLVGLTLLCKPALSIQTKSGLQVA